jgi:hypothetical protein
MEVFMHIKRFPRPLTIALTQEQHDKAKYLSDIHEMSIAQVIREMIDFSLTQPQFNGMENENEK